MENDGPRMKQAVNKFVIRDSIKELQSKRRFDSLQELTEAVIEDLFCEGFTLDSEERSKVARIVDEEGYTGNFALDDVLRRKLKNKKWLPVASVVLAAMAFLLTTSIAAVIEHYVQKPLESDRPGAPFTALFQIPEKTGDLLSFKVKLSNAVDKPLPNVVLFASAGEVTQQFKVEALGIGESRTIMGTLDVGGLPPGQVDFVAYVISGDFSVCSEPTTVAHESREVAMAPQAISSERSGKGKPSRRGAGSADTSFEAAPAASAAADAAEAAPAAPAAPSAGALPTRENAQILTRRDLEPSMREVAQRQLSSKVEVARLAQAGDATSLRLLEAYAAAGDEDARRLLSRE